MDAIARLTGVSQVTVSRALNHPDKVSPRTLQRITDAVRATGYVPNLVAGALASRRSRLVAALVPSMTNVVYAEMIQTFLNVVRVAGYQVLFGETGHSQAEEETFVRSVLSRRPDGVLLTGIHHTPACRHMLLGAKIPVVELWDVTETPIDICVGFSHAGAGAAVADFVHSKGYRQTAAITADDARALVRQEQFSKTVVERGLSEPQVVVVEGASIGNGRRGLGRLLDEGFRDGVVVCSSDLLAHGILIEAASRSIAVPQTLSVVGFGDQTFAADTHPALTSVRVDRATLGMKAAEAMLGRLRGVPFDVAKVDVGFTIIERATTRP